MAGNACASLHLDHVQAMHDLVVVQMAKLVACHLQVRRGPPGADNLVAILGLADRNFRTHKVTNLVKLNGKLLF